MGAVQRGADPRRTTAGRRRWSALPWVLVCILTAIVQFARGAPIDGAVFTVVALALGLTIWRAGDTAGRMHPPPLMATLVIAGAAAVALIATPRHGPVSGVVLVLLGALVAPVAWRGTARRPSPRSRVHPHDDPAALDAEAEAEPGAAVRERSRWRRSAWAWGGIVLAVGIVELIAWLASEVGSAEVIAFIGPSISEVLDGPLDSFWVHAAFVGVWLVAGAALLRGGDDAASL